MHLFFNELSCSFMNQFDLQFFWFKSFPGLKMINVKDIWKLLTEKVWFKQTTSAWKQQTQNKYIIHEYRSILIDCEPLILYSFKKCIVLKNIYSWTSLWFFIYAKKGCKFQFLRTIYVIKQLYDKPRIYKEVICHFWFIP